MTSKAEVPDSGVPADPVMDGGARANPTVSDLRLMKGLMIGIFIMVLIYAAYFAREFVMPVVLAFLLALMLTPIVRFLTKRAVVIALALCCVATGCQRDAATTAERAHVVPDEAAVLTATELIAIANVLRDAEERVLPRLGRQRRRACLRLRREGPAVPRRREELQGGAVSVFGEVISHRVQRGW